MSERARSEQEQPARKMYERTARLTDDVHRRLLTIQYERKMAGEWLSLSEIIGQLLDRAGAA